MKNNNTLQTSHHSPRLRWNAAHWAAVTLLWLCGWQATAFAQAPRPSAIEGVSSREATFSLNFVNAEIEAVVRAIGSFTNETFVVDPRVRGTITLVSPAPLNRQDAKNALLAALRLQGFTIVQSGGVAKVLPETEAKTQAAPTNPKQAVRSANNAIVTQVFELNFESASALVPILRPLIAPNNIITAYPENNTLVITDYADNLQRLARIIAAIDGPASGDLEVINLQHALAVDLAAIISKLLDEGNRNTGSKADPGQRITVLADPRTNSLMLRAASKARIQLARQLIGKLDQPTRQPGNIQVVYLKNAEAAQLAKTLQKVLGQNIASATETSGLSKNNATSNTTNGINTPENTSNFADIANTESTSFNRQSTNSSANNSTSNGNSAGIIQADTATNSLIITAPEPVYRNLRDIIEKLDVRRAQVYVESLIVEVSSDKAAEFGIQFQGLSGVNGSGAQLIGGTNFTTTGSGTNIIGASTNLGSIGKGLNIGVINGQINIPGLGTIANLGFLARALETKANANILSTPNLLTLDNEEAKIVIGQNVPFITGQYTNTGGGTATVSPFQTIERKDVGLTLRVKPQVTDGGIVKMGIYQEVSSVADSTNTAGLITSKRSIESNVLVETGNIIVLGGLVEDRVTGSEDKVPGLGDLPIIGNLFRYDNRRHVKTNLMVFLRPVIMRTEGDTQNIVTDRYDYMRSIQQNNKPFRSHFALPDMEMPILPPQPGPTDKPLQGRSSLPGSAE